MRLSPYAAVDFRMPLRNLARPMGRCGRLLVGMVTSDVTMNVTMKRAVDGHMRQSGFGKLPLLSLDCTLMAWYSVGVVRKATQDAERRGMR